MSGEKETVAIVGEDKGLGFVVQEVWAYLVVHGDGDEAIPAFHTGSGWMPMVAADRARLESLRPHAERTARASGKPVVLVRFDRRTDVETIQPRSSSSPAAPVSQTGPG